MSQYLPYGRFDWIEDVENFDFNVPANNTEGDILEVELKYPEFIYDQHSDLLLCLEHCQPPNSKK